MNSKEKIKVIKQVSKRIVSECIDNVPKMPENWNVFELALYLRDCFARDVRIHDIHKKRIAEYENDCIVNNL
jgi:hypothetical protein